MAKLAAVLDNLDGVDEAVRGFYRQADDGKYVLDLEGRPRGFVANTEHEQFRTNNHNLTNDLKTAKDALAKFDDVDLEKYVELKGAQDDLDRKALVKAGDMEGLVKTAVEKAVSPLAQQIEGLTSEKTALTIQLANKVVDEEIIKAGNAFGKMKSGTEEVLISKAKAAGFQNVKGELRQVINDTVQFSNENPGQPMTVGEWILADASKAFSWVWEPSTGGGGDGGDKGGDKGVKDGVKVVPRGDKTAFAKNLDAIAKGETVVAPKNP